MGEQPNDIRRGTCRCCFQPVESEAGAPRPFFATCAACSYINILDEGEVVFDSSMFAPAKLRDGADGEEILSALGIHAADKLNEARRLIRADRKAATRFLLQTIDERERRMLAHPPASKDIFALNDPIVFNFATQLLYLLLCEGGVIELSAEYPDYRHLYSSLWPLLESAVLTLRTITDTMGGHFIPSVRGGSLIQTKTADFTLVQEWGTNTRAVEVSVLKASDDDTFGSSQLLSAQQLVLGFSMREVFPALQYEFAGLAPHRSGELFLAAPERTEPAVAKYLSRSTLTLERLTAFKVPYYFDLGPRRSLEADSGLPPEALGMNWTAYYPFYEALAKDGHTRLVLFSQYVTALSLANMNTTRSYMMSRLVLQAQGESKTVVGQLQKEVSALLEDATGRIMRDQGWHVRVALTRCAGRLLPCGEIDVLAWRSSGTAIKILIVEVKDIDTPLFKTAFHVHAVESLKRGESQLERKAAWVAANWTEALEGKRPLPGQTLELIQLLVTRRYVPPGFTESRVTTVSVGALPDLLQRIARSEHGARNGIARIQSQTIDASHA